MAGKTYERNKDPLVQYCADHSLRLHPAQQALIDETLKLPEHMMLGSADEVQLLANLCKYMGAKKTIDVGVFTGYSALSIALVLPEDGKVIACDIGEKFTNMGKKHWKSAGVDHKIDLRVAPALDTLTKLAEDSHELNTYDFAFIDADKLNYEKYYELCLKLLRPGGLIALDNVLYQGSVLDASDNAPIPASFRVLNEKLAADDRVDLSMLTIADGLTLAFKKNQLA